MKDKDCRKDLDNLTQAMSILAKKIGMSFQKNWVLRDNYDNLPIARFEFEELKEKLDTLFEHLGFEYCDEPTLKKIKN